MAPPRQRWYNKLASFRVEDLFSRIKAPGPPRTVYFNDSKLPEDYYGKKGKVKPEHVYNSNQVITSKYTVITFLPRNLLEQFRRVANVFFAAIAVLQFFSKFSTISPGLVLFPLLVVLTITGLKDGYEDVKRHQSDRQVNHSKVLVLSAGDWVNPNAIKAKDRTFVRGIMASRSAAKKTGKAAKNQVEMAENGHAQTQTMDERNPDLHFDEEPVPTSPTTEHNPDHPHRHHLFHHDSESARPHWRQTLWEDIRVGDYVKIMDHQSFPADILICATSEDENVAFVETKNLDGETNLKSRNALGGLTHLRTAAACTHNPKWHIDCDRPDVNMYRLNATVTTGDKEPARIPVDMQNVVLRGTVLRNTKWIIGVVMFTGGDTKIVLNSGGTPSKRSKVERQMNPQVFINLAILALMAVACAIADSILEKQLYPLGAPWLYGADAPDDNPSINGLVTWAFSLITFQNIVPISLYISIEFVRTCQALFIYFDVDIWYEKTNQATLARSWNLSDDLGQIEYIFSDKTGTLTQNSMIFRQCSIGGKVYRGDPSTSQTDINANPTTKSPDVVSSSSSDPASSATATANPSQDPTAVPDPTQAAPPARVLPLFTDANLKNDLDRATATDPNPEDATHARSLNGFFSVLALCHTVLTSVDPTTGAIEYKAQSPDEAALVQAAADVGFVFRGRDVSTLTLQTPFSEQPEQYELLNILEFTSARKRMSVVVRKLDEDGRLFLLCKGADNVVFDRLKSGFGDELREETEVHLGEFASEGLRTLTLAYKVISDEEYAVWSERYHEATVAMDDREEKIEAVSDELERDLRLLGATAIEDSLQEGVPETIADLKRAGIKIWVATGDKLETAIAIGHSTNLIGRESNIIVIRGGNDHGRTIYEQMVHAVEEFFPDSGILNNQGVVIDEPSSPHSDHPHPMRRMSTGISSIVGSHNGERPGGFVLVIDGTALGHALGDEKHKDLLLRLAILCEGVICCRVSPLQKALVVKLVKDGLGAMTLAIGDGANDVSMIQAADVGVGISGEEGLQAVNSSDYAIAQFRFLKKLLLVHGHWSYARNGNMILNFFYKNVVLIGILWWFQIYDGWSANYAIEYTYLLFWNSFWTIAPVIGIGVFDRLIDSHVLMDIPELYRYGREGRWFGIKLFGLYMLDGIYQSTVIFFLILFAYVTPTTRKDGYDVVLYEFSTAMVFAAVFAANLFNGLNTNVWTGWVFFAVFLGIFLIWLYTVIYNVISPGWFATNVFGNDKLLLTSAYFWLSVPLTVCLALAPRYLLKAWKFGFMPDDIDILRWVRKMEPGKVLKSGDVDGFLPDPTLQAMRQYPSVASRMDNMSRTSSRNDAPPRRSVDLRSASRTDMATGIRSIHRGFDFSEEENGPAMRRMQSNISERRASSRHLPKVSVSTQAKKSSLGNMFSIRRGLLKRKNHEEEE